MISAVRSKRMRSRTIMVFTTSLLLVAIVLVLLIAGPIISAWLGGRALQWERLSQVGESYGGLSAVLSGIALVAVAGSLLLQRRQARANTVHAIRQRHFELAKIAIEHPVVAMELYGHAEAEVQIRIFCNLQMVHWAMLADLEPTSLRIIRTSASRLFRHPTARKWWSSASRSWLDDPSERVREMAMIVNEERERMETANPGPASPSGAPILQKPTEARISRDSTVMIVGALGVVAAVAVARHLARRRSSPSMLRADNDFAR